MATSVAPPKSEPDSREKLRIIDSDVHVSIPEGLNSVLPYLTDDWRERFHAKSGGMIHGDRTTKTMRFANPTNAALLPEAVSPRTGGPANSDPEFAKEELLDRWGIDCAVINTTDPGAYVGALAGPLEATVLCEAYNRFVMETWLPVDDRFRYIVCVNSQNPTAAADEIRRVGADARVAGVFVPPTGTLFGNNRYYPIYEAAQEFELPIWTHATGTEFIYQGTAGSSVGTLETYSERRVAFSQVAHANVSSIVFSGVLERFPRLNFCMAEFGFSWVLPFMWRMDDTWKMARPETPWVKKPPSEYVRERIRFTTQPIDEPEPPRHLLTLIEMLGPEVLMFSTDYPHFDTDHPDQVLRGMSVDARREIFYESPKRFWRL
jgi:predicted TIM-barrel fold metal-dependent hydrolase